MKRSPIRRVSKKRAKELTQYFKLRNEYLEDHQLCEMCNQARSSQIHHTNGRGMERLNKKEFWLAVCFQCHRFAHDNPEASMKAGCTLDKFNPENK